MKYFSLKTYTKIDIDLVTATLDQVLDAYNSLFVQSDDGGAFPTSGAAFKARKYAKQLAELVTARPEITEYRDKLLAQERHDRLSNTYLD